MRAETRQDQRYQGKRQVHVQNAKNFGFFESCDVIKTMSSQLCDVELNRRSLLFSLMGSSFCRSSAGRRTAVLDFEEVFFLNDLKDTARWFLFEVRLNIRLLSLST